MKISITLPTLFPELAYQAIQAIHAHTLAVDYEVIVVSPHEIRGPRILWVREDSPRGNSAAHALGYRHATGDFVVALSDDVAVSPFWINNLLDFTLERERHLHDAPFVVGMRSWGHLGTVFGLYYANFPVARRATLDAIGGYFSEEFLAHFADPDLSLRAWAAGGRCEICPYTEVRPIPRGAVEESPKKSSSKKRDFGTFIAKWGSRFGRGWKTNHIRDFNLDVPESLVAFLPQELGTQVLRERTIQMNDPSFRNLLLDVWRSIEGEGAVRRYVEAAW